MIADIFDGAVITAEHGIMILLGGFGVWTLERRLGRLIGDRLTRLEQRLDKLEAHGDS